MAALSVLHMICCNSEELSQMVRKGVFGSVIMNEDLSEKNFAKMTTMLHNRGQRKYLGLIERLVWDMDEDL